MSINKKEYEPIKNYGVIGNLETVALVSSNGSIDWLCLPDFDSASVFAAILDKDNGGFFKLCPVADFSSEQKYIEKTNVLETVFRTNDGNEAKITDFMPPKSDNKPKTQILIRKIEGIKGSSPINFFYKPKFDYARHEPDFKLVEDIIISQDDKNTLILKTDINLHHTDNSYAEEFILKEGNTHWFILSYIPEKVNIINSHQVSPVDDAADELENTINYWQEWSSKLKYNGQFYNEILRSALLLKLLIYNPSGALINSPTTSLPENISGHRNWDYRYVWLKDVAFAFHSFINLGYQEEAHKLFGWLQYVCKQMGRNLQPVVGLRGERSLIEHNLDYLSGYENSEPVRIGNDAYKQFELDSYGMVLRCALSAIENNIKPDSQFLDILIDYTNILGEAWYNPDNSIWEIRNMSRQFTFSKVAAYLGLDAGVKIARLLKPEIPNIDDWVETKVRIYNQVMERSWSEERNSFTHRYNASSLDASSLLLPILGFLPGDENMLKSTIKEIDKELSVDSLVYRYKLEEINDGIGENEGAYSTCSFWLAHAYALTGDKEKARSIIQNFLNYMQPLEIFSEEIDPSTKNNIGNYPHSPSHVSFINAALSLV